MADAVIEHRVLSDKLGVDIDPELLSVALTHRSFAYENGGIPHNERLEFLGDSILGQAVTVHLFVTHPELEEGALAKRRASVVSTVALAEVARGIDLGAHLRLGRGEDQTGGRDKDSILADTMEAVIGATADDITAAAAALTAMLKAGGEGPEGRFEALRVLKPVADYPQRHASTHVAMGALLDAVDMALATRDTPEAERTRRAGAA